MRILDLTLPTPAKNLACEEVLLNGAEAGESGEILRFWESPEYFAVVGYANKVASEVNVPACAARGIPILRRCSGGGTVLQGPGCLNYALVLQITSGSPTHSIQAANQFIMQRNLEAVASALGVPHSTLRIEGHTDLAKDGLKFSGNSQRRQRTHLLFHGTFLLNFDLGLIGELLRPPSLQPAYRQSRTHGEFVTNLRCPVAAVKCALAKTWQANEGNATISNTAIRSLAQSKYEQRDWNYKF